MRRMQFLERSLRSVFPVLAGCYSGSASSFSPRATMRSVPSGSGRCSAFASAQGAVSHVSHSGASVRITGIALGWTAPTSAFGAEVRSPNRSARNLPLLDLPHRGPGRPEAGEEGERPGLVEGEPDRRP